MAEPPVQPPAPAPGAAPEGPGAAPPGRPVRLYVAIGLVLLGLLVWGLIAYQHEARSPQALAKAEQLVREFRAAGLPVPAERDAIARVLGADGGPVCERPGKALLEAMLKAQLSNGASFVGQRPVLVARRVVQGEELVLRVYCPEKAEAFRRFIDDLKFESTIRP